ncbi:peptide-binding protein [Geobacter sp. DSM 9736]|uniref:peptide-binding protein n=1 Tax=Geobacter sp. DSM 9736 TaxID=1277350 RepID=UPI000B4FF07F|nr:peptide-binding protein [Geobacter sp. DSM 9736]SNB46086.1 peptide/nickel transport system substrate-binding protein [Geobacter sp. DSM 9736]
MREGRIVCLFLMLALLVACTRTETSSPPVRRVAGPPAHGDALVLGSIGEPSNLIPLLASDSASHDVAGYVFNGLVKYDKDLKLVGDLAETWNISADGLVITFRLRKGVKWHDGKDFTSRDVMYTYRVTVDPATPTAYAEDFKQVKSVEAPDSYTIRVTYVKPFAPALASWGAAVLPAHLLEGKDITKSELSRKPVGTGPYVFKEWVPGQKLTLESFNEYFEGAPFLSRIVYRIIPDTSTMYMELKAGGVDMMGLSPVQYSRQTDTAEFRSRFNKYRYPAFSYAYLGYNLKNPLFADRRVRQAVTSAINKDEIVHGVLLGMGQVARGPYKPGTWAWKPDIRDFDYNPQRAMRLLAEAGWTSKNAQGVLVKDGRPLQFTILTNQGNEQRLKAAQIIQQRLRVVGIDVKIRVIEWASLISNFIDKRDFDAILLGWTLGQDPDIFDVWHSSKTGPKELNFIGYRNSEVDRLIEKGRGTFDQEERRRCYWRIQDILAYDQPYTFLYVPDALPAVSARIRGIEPAPQGLTHNIIKWYVPKAEQVY